MTHAAPPDSRFTILDSSWGDWIACVIYLSVQSSSLYSTIVTDNSSGPLYICVDPSFFSTASAPILPHNSVIFSCSTSPSTSLSSNWVQVSHSNIDIRLISLFQNTPGLLGLPSISDLKALHMDTILLGSVSLSDFSMTPNIAYLPAFPFCVDNTVSKAFQLSLWLLLAKISRVNVLRSNPIPSETNSSIWNFLEASILTSHNQTLLDIPEVYSQADQIQPSKCLPSVPYDTILYHDNGIKPAIAVIISLFNYNDTILRALDTCLLQETSTTQLIIVDDMSTDEGLSTALSWCQRHASSFSSTILLSHHTNQGLAQARNTAASLVSSDWFFVLDADNTIHPNALSRLLSLSKRVPDHVAVIHPLIEIEYEHFQPSTFSQLVAFGEPWQYSRFLHGNIVDAMALVRKSSCIEVGGYSHIPFGWEDYDFWCKLLQSGFSGIQYPQILATYHVHPSSMLATVSNPHHSELVELMHLRYPWLDLSHLPHS